MTNMLRRWHRVAILLIAIAPASAEAQGVASGQIALLERAGERSEDLSDAVVWLEPSAAGPRRHHADDATMAVQARQFLPRVRVVMRSSRVTFSNGDSFSHNVFSKVPAGAFDTGVFGRGQSRGQTFAATGVYSLYCNIHPRMTGYVVVLGTPWSAQAGEDGRWSMPAVPAGVYAMHVWHPRGTAVTRTLVVPAAGVSAGRTEVDARGYRFVQHRNKFGQQYATSSADRY